jgi:hypothetical protein
MCSCLKYSSVESSSFSQAVLRCIGLGTWEPIGAVKQRRDTGKFCRDVTRLGRELAADCTDIAVLCAAAASKDRNVMVWDTRSQQPTPVATLGVKAGEQRTTHTGESARDACCGGPRKLLFPCHTRYVKRQGYGQSTSSELMCTVSTTHHYGCACCWLYRATVCGQCICSATSLTGKHLPHPCVHPGVSCSCCCHACVQIW